MSVPDPLGDMDPRPRTPPRGPLGPTPAVPPDGIPDPARPDPRRPDPHRPGPPGGRLTLVGTGRDDGHRHLVDVPPGEAGDPAGLRARCGAALLAVSSRGVAGAAVLTVDCSRCAAAPPPDPDPGTDVR